MLIVDQEATALLAATVKASWYRYDQAILRADCITSRRMTARPFGLRVACSRGTTLEGSCAKMVAAYSWYAGASRFWLTPLMWLPCGQLPA